MLKIALKLMLRKLLICLKRIIMQDSKIMKEN